MAHLALRHLRINDTESRREMKALLFRIKKRNPKWNKCVTCGAWSIFIAVYEVKGIEGRIPMCDKCVLMAFDEVEYANRHGKLKGNDKS